MAGQSPQLHSSTTSLVAMEFVKYAASTGNCQIGMSMMRRNLMKFIRMTCWRLLPVAIAAATTSAATTGPVGAVVHWDAPTINTDGTPLTDLIGFNVYHGTSVTAMMLAASLSADSRSYVESDLSASDWYWYVTAVNANGVEGDPSAIVRKTISDIAGSPGRNPGGAGTPDGTAGQAGSSADPSISPATGGSRQAARRASSTLCRPAGDVYCFGH